MGNGYRIYGEVSGRHYVPKGSTSSLNLGVTEKSVKVGLNLQDIYYIFILYREYILIQFRYDLRQSLQ
jgi:hypothetical protein